MMNSICCTDMDESLKNIATHDETFAYADYLIRTLEFK